MECLRIFAFTAACGLLSVALALGPALGLGWLLARRNWPGKAFVETLAALPLVLPPVATGLILLEVLGRRGVVGDVLWKCLGVDIAFTWKAVVIAMAVMAFPLLAGAARTAFEGVPRRLENLARTLGLGEAQLFLKVSLPLSARGLVSGALLGYARALGEFGATVTLAGAIPGRTETLATAIYARLQLGRDNETWPLLLCSAGAAFVLVWASRRTLRRPAP